MSAAQRERAEYEGDCSACGSPHDEGDLIMYDDATGAVACSSACMVWILGRIRENAVAY